MEDNNVGQSDPTQRTFAAEHSAVLPYRLQDAEGPPEALPHESVSISWRFGIGQRQIFILNPIAAAQKRHGQIGIFGYGIDMISAGFAHRRGTPCANGSRHHANCTERIQGTALKILTGDVLKCLPTGPDVHAVAHLRIPGNSADLGIQKMWH